MKHSTIMKSTLWSVALVAAAFLLPGCASSGKPPVLDDRSEARAYFDVLRSDFNATKVRTLNQVMKLTAEEADRFWPIYRKYEKDLAAVGDRKLALVVEFMRHHNAGMLSEHNSQELGRQFLRNAQDRLDLWKEYYEQISAAISPIRAAQFLQVEHQLALFVDISIASEMPAVGAPPK